MTVLTVEWLPDWQEQSGKDHSVQRMILETHASEDKLNYLMLAQVQLPLEDAENEARHYEDDRSDFEGFGCADGKVALFFFFFGWNFSVLLVLSVRFVDILVWQEEIGNSY